MACIFVPFNGSQFYDVAAYIYTGSNTWQFFPLFDPLFCDQFMGYHVNDPLMGSCGFF